MARQKKKKFGEVHKNPLVVEEGKPFYQNSRGLWRRDFFKKDLPLVAEVGCGRGEYTIGLARQIHDNLFIGIDVKGDRIWKGAREAREQNMQNAGFLRSDVGQLDQHFESGELDEIWITFPDPRPKRRDEKRRLTHPGFLSLYKKLLKKNGTVHFKTDNTALFWYTLELLGSRDDVAIQRVVWDLHNSRFIEEHYGIMTRYERKFSSLGSTIKYCRFTFIYDDSNIEV